ncbi:MAG: radical SAM protein [Phycisphaerales bacterium]
MSTPFAIPNPLATTSEQFARAAIGRVVLHPSISSPRPPLGGEEGALGAYRAFFREGAEALPRIVARPGSEITWHLPEVVRELRDESPEGTVIKFLTRIPAVTTYTDAEGKTTTLAPSSTSITQSLTHLEVESVLIPMLGSTGKTTYTLCVSSQVGCAMGCTFCETAQMGLIRSLAPHEIVAQWWAATHLVLGSNEVTKLRSDRVAKVTPSLRHSVTPSLLPVNNIVFMGMGEPMDNIENVIAAIEILRDHNGAHVPTSNITVSTVGRVDGINRLAREVPREGWHRLGIALSLNAPNDSDRSKIMPINRKYDLAQVRDALLKWPKFGGNKICVEYVLIPGENDTRQHAEQIADFIRPFGMHKSAGTTGVPAREDTSAVPRRGERETAPALPTDSEPIDSTTEPASKARLRAVLNLIPYNPRRNSPWPAPTEDQVEQFINWLIEEGVFVKRRRTKGRQMMGACGQLGSEQIRRRQVVTPTVSASRTDVASTQH